MDMIELLQIPKLNLETVKIFLEENNLIDSTIKLRRTRSIVPKRAYENITVSKIKLDTITAREKGSVHRTLSAEINEMQQRIRRSKAPDKKHIIILEFTGKQQNVSSASCMECSREKEKCGAIASFLYWIQNKQQQIKPEELKENKGRTEENAPKKSMLKRECHVLLARLDDNKYVATSTTTTVPAATKPVLKKIPVESVPIAPDQLEKARKLSMLHFIREFEGDDVDEFLKFCTAGMKAEVCDSVALLTLGQADTDLWHELRIGRITASRIREAARCTMKSGSLMNRIMGVSAGFSIAMKRGTDLEGQVLAELRKEYPGLRDTGLTLDPECPWMGASPDGICDEFVLEIKCPYTPKTYECYIDVKKLSAKYFAQIQLQMHVTRRTKALLAVAALDFETTKQIKKVWIEYDSQYVKDVIDDAFEFWRKAIFTALLRKRKGKK
uniref:YqaJ domain-containing protein n=1 Tax=Anopheles maculatus TaxID=74869 RepID=A0A182SIB9_9DIPT